MKIKFPDALKLAFWRFLWGAVGTWCTLGPIVLMNTSESASQELKVALVLLLALSYAVVIIICLRAKWDALKELASETGLAIGFMLVGLLLNEITGIFLAIKHKLVLLYAFAGFLLTELLRREEFIKAINHYLRKHVAKPDNSSIKNAFSKEQTLGALPDDKDGLAQQIAELCGRLAENQITLAEYEEQQRSSISEQTENHQLREVINTLESQLQASESQVEQSTVRMQEAVGLNATLQNEVAALTQRLEAQVETIEMLQSAAQHAAGIQCEIQALRLENQGLQDEVASQRIQLTAREIELQELARQNLDVSRRYERIETEVNDLRRRLEDSESRNRQLETARQQLASLADRENYYRKQQPLLEARIIAMERKLTEAKSQAQAFDDARRRLRDTEFACHELADENYRLWKKLSSWQERFAAIEEFHVAPDTKGTQVVHTGAIGDAELARGDRDSLVPAKPHERTPYTIAIWESNSRNKGSERARGAQSQLSSEDSTAGVLLDDKEVSASWLNWTAVKQQWHSGALAASIVVIAGAVAIGIWGSRLSPSKEVSVAAKSSSQEHKIETVSKPPREPAPQLREAVSPKIRSTESAAEPVLKPQRKPTPQPREALATVRTTPTRGTFETVLPTQVYSGPSENSALVAAIHAGTKVNVIDSSYGWLEIRSKHGRPPGFIRQETAIMIAQN